MKKTAVITIKRTEAKAVEIEFPLYSMHDVSDDNECVYYHRLGVDMKLVTISKWRHGSSTEYKVEVNTCGHISRSDNEDYILGRGEYACPAAMFNQVLAEAIAFIQSVVLPEAIAESVDGIKTFSLWITGYAATGESSPARHVADVQGTDFNDAIKRYVESLPDSDTSKGYWSFSADNRWRMWGCTAYDNEADARRPFG